MSGAGRRVRVLEPDTGRVLFTGRLADTPSPWAGHTRVIPDAEAIDLASRYKVVEIEDDRAADAVASAGDLQRWRASERARYSPAPD